MQNSETEQIAWFDDRYYKVKVEGVIKEILEAYHMELALQEEIFLPSSTTVLGIINKPFLASWRGDVGNELANHKMRRGAELGSVIHDAVHKLINFEKSNTGHELQFEEYTQEEWVQIMRFKEWYDEFKPEILASELTVANYQHLYAGTLDMLCLIQPGTYNSGKKTPIKLAGGIYVGDLKTGKAIDKSANYQTASYASAVKADVRGSFVLHTNAKTTTKWSVTTREDFDLEEDFGTFLASKRVWDAENPTIKPAQLMMPPKIQLQKYVTERK